MMMDACRAAIRQVAPELSDADVGALARSVVDRKQKLSRASVYASDSDLLDAAQREIAEAERMAAYIEQRNRAINVLRKQERMARYATAVGRESEALKELMVGSQAAGTGAAKSVAADELAIRASLLGPMIEELRTRDLLRHMKSADRELNLDVARELRRLTGGNEPATGNKVAADIASVIGRVQEAVRVMRNDAGAFVGKSEGYIVRQAHDQTRVRGRGTDADFTKWRDTILPLLDERTFDDIDDIDAFLRHAWTGLATGQHLKANGESDWLMGFVGPSNIAKRISASRSLHFKDAEAWYRYNEQFGVGNVIDAALHGIDNAARDISIMRVFGTNPEAAYLADHKYLIERAHRRGDIKQVEALNNWKMRAYFDEISGIGRIADNPSLAAVASSIRAWLSMAKLGGVLLASIPDISIRAAALRHNGAPLLQSYGDAFNAVLEGRSKGERRAIADEIAAGIENQLGAIYSRFSANDHLSGRMTKIMSVYFRLNGLTWWVDGQKTSHALRLAHDLGRMKDTSFDKLNEKLRTELGRYGIDERDWDMLRRATVRQDESGRVYMTPDGLKTIGDNDIGRHYGLKKFLPTDQGTLMLQEGYRPGDIRRARLDLELKMRAYYSDQVRQAMTEAGAGERAIMRAGTQPGTIAGELIRFAMQFKSFPVSYLMIHMNREIQRGGAAGIAHLIAGTTIMGYLAMTAKDFAKGRNPRQIDDVGDAAKIMGASMLQGGGLGLFGDFLFAGIAGEARTGAEVIASAMGPAVGVAGELLSIFGQGTDLATGGKGKGNIGANATRFVVNNLPGVNIFWARAALEAMVLQDLYEQLSPGYARRQQRRLKEEYNQTMWLAPRSAW